MKFILSSKLFALLFTASAIILLGWMGRPMIFFNLLLILINIWGLFLLFKYKASVDLNQSIITETAKTMSIIFGIGDFDKYPFLKKIAPTYRIFILLSFTTMIVSWVIH